MKLNTENTTCRNCQTEMPEQSLYCPKCSQKNTDGRIPILSFVKDLLENIFSLDSKLLRTSLGLFVPGKLTNEFFKGKHKSFATPSRMFLTSAILFFAMVSIVFQREVKDEKFDGDIFGITDNNKVKKGELAYVKKLRDGYGDDLDKKMEIILDSMELQIKESFTDTNFVNVVLWDKSYKIKAGDIDILSADSMIQKYEIESLLDRMSFKQAYKFAKDPKSLIFKLISNLTWMMLLLIPSLALIFKLLYIRRKKYYVEHLVFLFHIHSFFLLIGSVVLILEYFFETEIKGEWISLLMMNLFVYLLFAFKKVYQQGWIKTLAKLFLIFIAYIILLLLCFMIISMVSFILF